MNKLIFLVGMCGSGKSTVGDFFKGWGWNIVRFGDATDIELKNRKLERNETNERFVREDLRRIHGKDAFAKLAIPRLKESLETRNTIGDGLYSWSEYKLLWDELSEEHPFKVIAVVADKTVRYTRLSKRNVRPLTIEEAASRDVSEIQNVEKGGPIAFADIFLLNHDKKRMTHEAYEIMREILNG